MAALRFQSRHMLAHAIDLTAAALIQSRKRLTHPSIGQVEENKKSVLPFIPHADKISNLPTCFSEFSAPNVFFSDERRTVEFVASHTLSAQEEGVPSVLDVVVTTNNPIPHQPPTLKEYYFEVTLSKAVEGDSPTFTGMSVGLRSLNGDWFLRSDGQKWHVPREQFDRSRFAVGWYVDIKDMAQRPPKWEPARVLEANDGKVKVGWLFWPNPEYHQWIDRRSDVIAPYLSKSSGSSPQEKDRQFEKFCEPFKSGDVIGCGYNLREGRIFFTKNGRVLGDAWKNIPLRPISPAVELRASFTRCSINLGQDPFVYQLLGAPLAPPSVIRARSAISSSPLASPTSALSPTTARTPMTPAIEFAPEEMVLVDESDEVYQKRLNECVKSLEAQEKAMAQEEVRMQQLEEERNLRRLGVALEMIQMLPGSSEDQLVRALELHGDDMQRTMNWIFNQPDPFAALANLKAPEKPKKEKQRRKEEDGKEEEKKERVQNVAVQPPFLQISSSTDKDNIALATNLSLQLDLGQAYDYDDDVDEEGVSKNENVSEEVQVWLQEVESGLRRARMERSAIERIMIRLREDNRDMVALLQAREVLPNLRDAPQPKQSDDEENNSALAKARAPTLEELEVGMRVLVSPEALQVDETAKLWLPEMDSVLGCCGVIVRVDSDSLPPLALVRIDLVDPSIVHEWWLQLDALRIVATESRDAYVGLADLDSALDAVITGQEQIARTHARQALLCILEHSSRLSDTAAATAAPSGAKWFNSDLVYEGLHAAAGEYLGIGVSGGGNSQDTGVFDLLGNLAADVQSKMNSMLCLVPDKRALYTRLLKETCDLARTGSQIVQVLAQPAVKTAVHIRSAGARGIVLSVYRPGTILPGLSPAPAPASSPAPTGPAASSSSVLAQNGTPILTVFSNAKCTRVLRRIDLSCHAPVVVPVEECWLQYTIRSQSAVPSASASVAAALLASVSGSSSSASTSSSSAAPAAAGVVSSSDSEGDPCVTVLATPIHWGFPLSAWMVENRYFALHREGALVSDHLKPETLVEYCQNIAYLLRQNLGGFFSPGMAPPLRQGLVTITLFLLRDVWSTAGELLTAANALDTSTALSVFKRRQSQFDQQSRVYSSLLFVVRSNLVNSTASGSGDTLSLLAALAPEIEALYKDNERARKGASQLSTSLLQNVWEFGALLATALQPASAPANDNEADTENAAEPIPDEQLLGSTLASLLSSLPAPSTSLVNPSPALTPTQAQLLKDTITFLQQVRRAAQTGTVLPVPNADPDEEEEEAEEEADTTEQKSDDGKEASDNDEGEFMTDDKWTSMHERVLVTVLEYLAAEHDSTPTSYELSEEDQDVLGVLMQQKGGTAMFDGDTVKTRADAILSFNKTLSQLLTHIDLGHSSISGRIASDLSHCRSLIFRQVKDQFLHLVLDQTSSLYCTARASLPAKLPSSAPPSAPRATSSPAPAPAPGSASGEWPRFPVHINRLQAAVATQPGQSIFEQALREFRDMRVASERLRTPFTPPKGVKPVLPFEIHLKGEKVVGSDGPYRAFFSDVCRELQNQPHSVVSITSTGVSPPPGLGGVSLSAYARSGEVSTPVSSTPQVAQHSSSSRQMSPLEGVSDSGGMPPPRFSLSGASISPPPNMGQSHSSQAIPSSEEKDSDSESDDDSKADATPPLPKPANFSTPANRPAQTPSVNPLASPVFGALGINFDTTASVAQQPMGSLAPDLLVRCPNGVLGVGLNREAFLLRPSRQSEEHLAMYRFLGQLMGIALRTSVLLSLDLGQLFWKQFVDEPVTLADLEAVDRNVVHFMSSIRNCASEDDFNHKFKDTPLSFTCLLSDNTEVELVPNGHKIRVNFQNRLLYVSLVEWTRLRESELQIRAIRDGFGEVVPLPILSIFTGEEMAILLCGKNTVDLEVLKRHTEYGGDLKKDHTLIKNFWKVLEEFNEENRLKFIEFVYAQRRLPSAEEFVRQRLRMLVHPLDVPRNRDPDKTFPHSDTCFFNLKLPRYTTLEKLRENLLLAINSASGFGLDEEERQLSNMSRDRS